jgi:hypothetical protein
MTSQSIRVVLGLTLVVAATAAAPAASEPQAAALGLGFHAETDDISIRAYPRIAAFGQPVIVSGDLTPARAKVDVTVQGKECGVPGAFFRSLSVANTNEAGGWEAELSLNTKTVLRAVSGKQVSPELTVRVRVPISLTPQPGKPGRFRLMVGGVVPLRGKRAVIQRFDPAAREWRTVRSFILPDTGGKMDDFRLQVPKGTTVRAHVPASQAKPCYLAGYSKLIRT